MKSAPAVTASAEPDQRDDRHRLTLIPIRPASRSRRWRIGTGRVDSVFGRNRYKATVITDVMANEINSQARSKCPSSHALLEEVLRRQDLCKSEVKASGCSLISRRADGQDHGSYAGARTVSGDNPFSGEAPKASIAPMMTIEKKRITT